MEYLIRFVQIHETFRRPEIEALAELAAVRLQWIFYSEDSPFAVVSIDGKDAEGDARRLISRSVLSTAIFELWGVGSDYDNLHRDVVRRTSSVWTTYRTSSFRFNIDSFRGSRSSQEKRDIVESFAYTSFDGPIIMNQPDHTFTVFEDYLFKATHPHKLYLGRLIADSGRRIVNTYTLKKRKYIATTSMDSELSLVTANLALSAPGKLAYDPFMGTGSFPLACAHFGSMVCGSDLDGRSIRGKGSRSVAANFDQYGTSAHYLGGFAADITNTPLEQRRFLDIMLCDPPYGVREGLKVLGHVKDRLQGEILLPDGTPAHLQQDFIPPKRPYSFLRMLDDILDFAASRLVDDGRLCMWMPVAGASEDVVPEVSDASKAIEETGSEIVVSQEDKNGEDSHHEYDIPQHPCLEVVSVCRQDFNKWSRRLLTYRRRHDASIDSVHFAKYQAERLAIADRSRLPMNSTANDLNDFRKKYFEGFKNA